MTYSIKLIKSYNDFEHLGDEDSKGFQTVKEAKHCKRDDVQIERLERIQKRMGKRLWELK